MKIVLIHGSPAVGKLTIAKELSKITDYKIFHSHLTMDLVNSIFEQNTKTSFKLIRDFRFKIFETAAKKGLKGIIFTFVDVASDKFKFVKRIIKLMKKYKGKIHFVHLSCEEKELYKRVKNNSRKKFRKITSSKKLKKLESEWDFHTTIPFAPTLKINNTKLPAKKVAIMIKEHYHL